MYIYVYIYVHSVYIYISIIPITLPILSSYFLGYRWLCAHIKLPRFALAIPRPSSFKSSSSSMSPEGSCQPVDTLVSCYIVPTLTPQEKQGTYEKKHQRHHPQQQEMRKQNKKKFLNRKIHITPDLTDKNCGCTNQQ